MGAGFDDAFDTIAIGTGASGKDLEGLQDDFKSVFSAIPTDMEAASNAIANLNTYTGATGETLQEMSKSVLEASRLLGEDGVANSQAFGKALQQWQIPAERAPELMDKLFKITQDTGSGLGELIGQLNTYGPVMKNAGFSTEETAELMGRMNAAGISWSRISPGLNASFRRWAAAGKEPREEFERVIERIKNAESSTKALTIATDAFGAEGAQRLTTGIRNGTLALDDLGATLEGTDGLIQKTANETNDFAEQWAVFRNKAMTALEPVASAVFELAGTVMDRLGPVLEDLAQWVADNMPMIQSVFQTVFSALGFIIETFVGVIRTLIDWISQWAQNNQEQVTRFQEIFTQVFGAVQGLIVAFVGFVTAFWNTFGEDIIAFTSVAFETVANLIEVALNIITDIFNIFSALFRGDWEALWEGVKSLFLNIWDGMYQGLKGTINLILTAINGMINQLNKISFSVPDWVPVIGGRSWGFNLPKIPLLAKGGRILEEGAAIVGEQGPELLNLPRGATVAPLGSGGALGGITFERGAFEGAIIMDDYGVDRLMERIAFRARELGVT